MNYADYLKEELRLVILRILNELPSYTGNSSTLHGFLGRWGLNVSRDQVKTALYWLREQGCISIDLDTPDVLVVKLSSYGQDVAEGRTTVPGIKRPSA